MVRSFSFLLRTFPVVDFFNEVSLIWGIVHEVRSQHDASYPLAIPVGSGFPRGFEYRWADGSKTKAPIRCSGPQYVDNVLTWTEEKLNDDKIFPRSEGMHAFNLCL
jgi:MOB kinase activator 1